MLSSIARTFWDSPQRVVRSASSIRRPRVHSQEHMKRLQAFLAEASQQSTEAVIAPSRIGYLYELHTMATLERNGIDVEYTGGTLDGGIDFRGVLSFGSGGEHGVPVIGQCKADRQRIRVSQIREFEGVLTTEPRATLGIYSSRFGFTDPAQKRALQSPFPLVLMTCDGTMQLHTFLLNEEAQKLLPSLIVAVDYRPRRGSLRSGKKSSEAMRTFVLMEEISTS